VRICLTTITNNLAGKMPPAKHDKQACLVALRDASPDLREKLTGMGLYTLNTIVREFGLGKMTKCTKDEYAGMIVLGLENGKLTIENVDKINEEQTEQANNDTKRCKEEKLTEIETKFQVGDRVTHRTLHRWYFGTVQAKHKGRGFKVQFVESRGSNYRTNGIDDSWDEEPEWDKPTECSGHLRADWKYEKTDGVWFQPGLLSAYEPGRLYQSASYG
jgi:hypothetical protein